MRIISEIIDKSILLKILKFIKEAIILTDADGNIIYSNEIAEEVARGSKIRQGQALEAFRIYDLFIFYDTIFNEEINNMRSYIDENGPLVEFNLSSQLLIKDKNNIPMEGYCFTYSLLNMGKNNAGTSNEKSQHPDKDLSRLDEGMIFIFNPIKWAEELQSVKKKQRIENLGFLMGGLAHDLNNILMAIWGNVQLTKMDFDEHDEVFQNLSEVEKSIIEAQELIKQLSQTSKGIKKVCGGEDLVESIKNSVILALSGSKILPKFRFDDNLWPIMVDSAELNQAIINIIKNSVEAMPGGGIINVDVSNITLEDRGEFVKILIKDNGIGIPEEDLEFIFNPFFTTKQNASGLGLWLVKTMIKQNGGFVEIKSELGEGTELYMYLPKYEGAQDINLSGKNIAGTSEISQNKPEDQKIEPKRSKRVLILEDDEYLQKLIKRMITKLNFIPKITQNGAETIEVYKNSLSDKDKNGFDYVILDATIKGGLGAEETIEELKKLDPDVKAIISSGYTTHELILNYKKYGFVDILLKPYGLSELKKVLK
ncbi:MAG: hybrid sensor histidine kinase/response regulator [Promethearchaeota archaeon]